MTATHAQRDEPLTDEQRAIRKRGADLCRADPALWSRAVMLSDRLQADGVERYEAIDQALRAAGV